MHGFAQGEHFIRQVCDENKYDVIFIQEHWLNSQNLNKFNKFNNYLWFGMSAMDSLLSHDVLKGRPFGGTLTLAKKSLSTHMKHVLSKERVVIIEINNILFINVYLPCNDSSLNYRETLLEIFTDISDAIDDINYKGLVFGGDFNCKMSSNGDHSHMVKDFLDAYDMKFIDLLKYNVNDAYTFSNEAKGSYTIIDYLCISTCYLNSVNDYSVIHSALNFSDHLGLAIVLNFPILSYSCLHGKVNDCSVEHSSSQSIEGRFRFDHCNTGLYYEYTRQLLTPLSSELNAVYKNMLYGKSINELCSNLDIERWYTTLVNSLLHASFSTVPYTTANVYKHWWDEGLNLAKEKCILSHTAWVAAGNPRCGPIFVKRNEDKKNYRHLIRCGKEKEKKNISSNLLSSLCNKNKTNFWKIWKGKVCNNGKVIPKIEGSHSVELASDKFKLYFEDLNNNVDNEFESAMESKFNSLLNSREVKDSPLSNCTIDPYSYSVLLIDVAVSKLHSGKAPGIDNLIKEHLVYSHPMLYEILARLFFICVSMAYVPNQFGLGIIVPILKDSSIRGCQKLDNFRGITLSPIISKVFENCLLFLYGKYLKSSDRQFGFKTNTGCTHAIYSVRSVVDYFVKNDSTINICCLDISKAFDNLSHKCLFYKLLQRYVPLSLINILRNWYSKLHSSVRWGCIISNEFRVTCGIRQGGVLSPILFSIYVDNILTKLSKLGCMLNGVSYGSFMYADDLVLLAPSVNELQNMINICDKELNAIRLKFNVKKSGCLRIGRRCFAKCCDIYSKSGIIPWVKEIKYLGLKLVSSIHYKINFDEMKCKFYASFNTLYSKIGCSLDWSVTVHLLESIAVPSLLYAVESLDLCKSDLLSLEHSLSKALYKIFRVSSRDNVEYCMSMFGIKSVNERYVLMKLNFINKIKKSNNPILSSLLKVGHLID